MGKVRFSLEGERVGLFTLDPGRTSGITASTPLLDGTVQEIFERDPLFVDEVNCNDLSVPELLAEVDGAKVIAETYMMFEYKCVVELGIQKPYVFFVFEDFVLRQGSHSTDRHGLSPVRVTSLVQGLLVEQNVNWVAQSPSDAKSTFPNQRLKSMGLWTVGMEHGRDATRHAALWARRAMT